MSNHAYVISRDLPDDARIDADVREIVGRKFPQLTVDSGDGIWLVWCRPQPLGIEFWRSAHENVPCIEFNHGHPSHFLWWLEYEIREELAVRYVAKIVDDCDGEECDPQTERFATCREYVERNFGDLPVELMTTERRLLPPPLHQLLGEGFGGIR